MRKISIGDIIRILLKTFELYDQHKKIVYSYLLMGCNLKITLTMNSEYKILKQLYGLLSYRNVDSIKRTFERYSIETKFDDKGNAIYNTYNLLDIWDNLGKKYLIFKDNVYINILNFEEWKRYFHALDEDLIVLNHLVKQRYSCKKPEISNISQFVFKMKTFITPYEPKLKAILNRGVGIQHLHLSGSYPAPYLWVALMNNRIINMDIFNSSNFDEAIKYNNIENIAVLCKMINMARIIRLCLFEYIIAYIKNGFKVENRNSEKMSILLSELSKNINHSGDYFYEIYQDINIKICELKANHRDYAFTLSFIDDDNCRIVSKSLVGERLILFYVLYLINDSSFQDNEILSKLIWIYIQAKNSFLCKVQQEEGISGIDFFEYTLKAVVWSYDEDHEFCKEIGEFLQETQSVIKAELMISPQSSLVDYDKKLKQISIIRDSMRASLCEKLKQEYQDVKIGVIVHFKKDDEVYLSKRISSSNDSYKISHFQKRDVNIQDCNMLIRYKKETNTFEKNNNMPIVAIDATSKEVYCSPEIFSEAYNLLFGYNNNIESGFKLVGRTFHVGEEYISLATGLRRIYEAICFLGLEKGDRLGHCIALGVDSKLWVYDNPQIDMSLIDLLDDYVFEWHLLKNNYNYDFKNRINEIEMRIAKYSKQVFGVPIYPTILFSAWQLRGNISHNLACNFDDDNTIPYWIKLQGKIMECSSVSGTHQAIPSLDALLSIADKYNIIYDKLKVELPCSIEERILHEYLYDKHTNESFIQRVSIDTVKEAVHLKNIQDIVADFLYDRGISIESNPTSNWLIGGFEKFYDIPCVQWIINKSSFAFSLNIDDPTAFGNSVENEYYLVYSSIRKCIENMISEDVALKKINEIRLNSIKLSFI